MRNKNRAYRLNWDQYYQRTYGLMQQKALWDVPPEQAVAVDFQYFEHFFDKSLPLLDLGCGTGTQEVFLAKHFQYVIGLDVSDEAVRLARKDVVLPNVSFEALDATDVLKAEELYRRVGDSNVYIRAMLHQLLEDDLTKFQQVILTLMGKKGKMYCVEVADSIREYFENSKTAFSRLPKQMQRVFISNLPPTRGLNLIKLTDFFPEKYFKILDCGETRLSINIYFPGGENIHIPAIFAKIEPADH